MIALLVYCFVVIVLIIIYNYLLGVEHFERRYSTIYDHPTKCFSCERDVIQRYGEEWAWLGQNTKSFDAEKEMIRMTGDIASAMDTHPIKYY